MKKKVCILGICLSFFIAACGANENENSNKGEISDITNICEDQSEETEIQKQVLQENEALDETEEGEKYFETDEVVNDFFH